MTHNNQPNSFFNNPDSDDNAETNIDVPYGTQSPQGSFNPYGPNPYQQPPNYGQPGPISGNHLPPVNPQMPPRPQEQPQQPPNYGQPYYQQPPNYGAPNPSYPLNSGYGPDHSQQVTNLPGAQPPNYGPQGGYIQPPTHLPPYQNGWQDAGETRLDVSDQPQLVQPLGLLIVKRPLERRGYAHHVRGAVTIGRRAGNILLATDDLVSEYHTSIRLGDPVDGEPAFWIADMNSRNGTKVNGVKIEGRYRLQNGDEIGIGRSIFVFMMLKD
jgi:hypothetical protein